MKNCMPILAADYSEALNCVDKVIESNCELIEWRLDALNGKVDMEKVINTCRHIKGKTDKKLIVTLRTARQGGLRDMDPSNYVWMIRRLIDLAKIDFVDIEMANCAGDAQLKMLIRMAKKKGVNVIVSYHDMIYTESAREIYMRLCHMKYLGADLPKVAYMANNEGDVEALVNGATTAVSEIGPVIAISMGELGKVTRIEGDKFGSIVNFVKPIGSKADQQKNIGQLDENQLWTGDL